MKGAYKLCRDVYIIMSISLSVDRRRHSLHLLEYSWHRSEVGKAHTICYIAEWERTVGEQHNLGLLHFQIVYPWVEIASLHIVDVVGQQTGIEPHLFSHLRDGDALLQIGLVVASGPLVHDIVDRVGGGNWAAECFPRRPFQIGL